MHYAKFHQKNGALISSPGRLILRRRPVAIDEQEAMWKYRQDNNAPVSRDIHRSGIAGELGGAGVLRPLNCVGDSLRPKTDKLRICSCKNIIITPWKLRKQKKTNEVGLSYI